jgi:hypothetical protein
MMADMGREIFLLPARKKQNVKQKEISGRKGRLTMSKMQ